MLKQWRCSVFGMQVNCSPPEEPISSSPSWSSTRSATSTCFYQSAGVRFILGVGKNSVYLCDRYERWAQSYSLMFVYNEGLMSQHGIGMLFCCLFIGIGRIWLQIWLCHPDVSVWSVPDLFRLFVYDFDLIYWQAGTGQLINPWFAAFPAPDSYSIAG